jgi:hypothetical protein
MNKELHEFWNHRWYSNVGTFPELVWNDCGKQRKSKVMKISVPAEIRLEILPSPGPQRYR